MPESLGKTLKKIREGKFLSIEDVSEKTRIPKKIVSNIEEDRLGEISTPFYAKGFVRSYAQFLKAIEENPVKEYLSGIKIKAMPQLILKDEKVPGDWFLKYKKHAGVAVLTIFCIWLALFSFTQVARFTKNAWARHKARVAERQTQAASEVKPKAVKVVKKTPVVAETVKPEKEMVSLEIEARYNTWLHVVSNEKTLFKGTLRRKEKDSWQAEKVIELKLGNAGGVNLKLNGKNLGVPGKRGEKKTLIVTKDGLKEQR